MDLHATVTEFFRGQVTDALRSRGVSAAEPTEFYLVNLLAEYTRPGPGRVDAEPLALKMAELSTASPDIKVRGLKEIGDTSLVTSGFFADSLTRRLVDVDYYIAMGATAYGQLSGLIGATRGSATEFFQRVYAELAAKFAAFVEVLNEVRRNTSIGGGNGNLVRLCEEWLKTGSDWLGAKLREAGVVVLDAAKKN
jgi:hypothetical protein